MSNLPFPTSDFTFQYQFPTNPSDQLQPQHPSSLFELSFNEHYPPTDFYQTPTPFLFPNPPFVIPTLSTSDTRWTQPPPAVTDTANSLWNGMIDPGLLALESHNRDGVLPSLPPHTTDLPVILQTALAYDHQALQNSARKRNFVDFLQSQVSGPQGPMYPFPDFEGSSMVTRAPRCANTITHDPGFAVPNSEWSGPGFSQSFASPELASSSSYLTEAGPSVAPIPAIDNLPPGPDGVPVFFDQALPEVLPCKFYILFTEYQKQFLFKTVDWDHMISSAGFGYEEDRLENKKGIAKIRSRIPPILPHRLWNPIRPAFPEGYHYPCPLCNEILPNATFSAVNQHLIRRHPTIKQSSRHTCEACGREASGEDFARHIMKTHFRYHASFCRLCGKTSSFWTVHMKDHVKTCKELKNLLKRMRAEGIPEGMLVPREDVQSPGAGGSGSKERPAKRVKRDA
ncbi:hypothetical protein K435DRAFT_854435 [Dendrothele bispora CBS 962.96]|uniref:C2H2-type domain-containing protein n=1 Tax=Dendrothele bispora (strain CBS 962.96) TaxID=1314807 RepID=A0A4S8MF64_DENBC|nr:hypothetical protein K435DRAFT_854435 [Dendrothele bispora CBS 962.96]